MSVVAISQTLGSLDDEVGQELARMLGYQFADHEVIARAAERYGQNMIDLEDGTEEKPGLWERLTDTKRRYLVFVEAVVFEMAARDKIILAGRGAPILLRGIRHALRVRITAPDQTRIARVQHQYSLSYEGAARYVSKSDQERGARVRFLYHVNWNDPLLYDVILNTERLSVGDAARILLEALLGGQFEPTADSVQKLNDLALTAQARAILLKAPSITGPAVKVKATAMNGYLQVSGTVETEEEREAVLALLKAFPGAKGVLEDLLVSPR